MSSPSQKVVIPKGLVNPHETTIVEIPAELHNVGTVVAKARIASTPRSAQLADGSHHAPPGGRLLKKSSYLRQTLPKRNMQKRHLHEMATSFGGRDCDPADESASDYQMQDHSIPSPGHYTEFRPGKVSSLRRPNAPPPNIYPQYSPPSMRSYHSESSDPYAKWAAGPGDPISTSTPSSYRKTSVTTELPDGKISQTDFEEESYEDNYEVPAQPRQGPILSSPSTPGSSYYSAGACPSSCGRPGTASHSGQPSQSSSKSTGNVTQNDLMDSLGNLESSELHNIMSDLNNFHDARRKLLIDASNLASAADVSSSIMSRASESKHKQKHGTCMQCCQIS